jgi:hypothetical protein
VLLDSRLLLARLIGDEEHHRADHVRVDSPSSVDDLLALLHLVANLGDELWISCPCVVLEVLSEVHQGEVVVVVGQYPRILFDFTQEIDLEVLAERIGLLDVRGIRREDEVPQLYAVVWQTVDEIEVEITEEVGKVLLDHADDSQGGMVESLDGWRNSLSWNHVALEESEDVDDELGDLESSLVECVVCAHRTEATRVLKAWDIDELLLAKQASCAYWLGALSG